jgi:hypothetical protein
MTNEVFWIVLRDPAHPTSATVTHATRDAAATEAERLAMKHAVPFYVYRVSLEGTAQPQRPLWVAA